MKPPSPTHQRRIGLLGGSFNPAHAGHVQLSLEAIKHLHLDAVWWLVSPCNPLKSIHDLTPTTERVCYANDLTRLHKKIYVTTLEQQLHTQYSIDTITALKQRFASAHFVWLMGADNLAHFHHWRSWESIFLMIPIAIFDRNPFTYTALTSQAAQRFSPFQQPEKTSSLIVTTSTPAWCYIRMRPHPASSTLIRAHNHNVKI